MTQSEPPSTPGLTRSDILPFRSTHISLLHSRATLPLALTVLAFFFFTLSPFNTRADIDRFIDALGCFLALIIFIEIYYYASVTKSIGAYSLAALFVAAQLLIFAEPWFLLFHGLLGGEPKLITSSTSALEVFRIYFVGPGCMEETMKACPALIGLWLARRAAKHPDRLVERLKRALMLNGPMDGLMTGVAAAIGFLLVETLIQYVPDTIAKELNDGAGLGTAGLIGVNTLIARIINVVMGHGAWAGITGYFIGLAVRHREAQFRLIFGSLLLAAFLHAGWDASIQLNAVLPLAFFGVLSPLLFLSCLVKAHQLQAIEQPATPIDRSIVIPHKASSFEPPTRAVPVGVRPQSRASHLARLVTLLEHAVDLHGRGHAAPPPAPPMAADRLQQTAPEPVQPTAQSVAPIPGNLASPTFKAPGSDAAAASTNAIAQTARSRAAPANVGQEPTAIRLILIIDSSGSMAGERMASVSYSVRSLLPMLARAAQDHAGVDVRLEVLRFGEEAAWVTPGAVQPNDFTWSDIPTGGGSNLGAALALLAERLGNRDEPHAAFVLLLFSDGLPTDDPAPGFAALLNTAAGAKAKRFGVAVGPEADRDFLSAFGGALGGQPFTPETLGELLPRMPWPKPRVPEAAPAADPAVAVPAGVVW